MQYREVGVAIEIRVPTEFTGKSALHLWVRTRNQKDFPKFGSTFLNLPSVRF